ncbi:MAG: class I SAM-dependent methyltransferase [Hyphomicrobiales bacterium]|nr:class I SAM-dependent methyltransferase [Hyphomicrobiales bacterium]
MKGHGFYDRHSTPQRATIDAVLPWLEDAIANMRLTEGSPTIGVADFGCSEGRNSIAATQAVVAAVRKRTAQPILTMHTDLPLNDYSRLLTMLRPEGRSVFNVAETYSAVVGGSFYGQLLPPRSLHVATTFNSIGYLSRRPIDRLEHHVQANGPSTPDAPGSVSQEEKEAFLEQTLADMESFLRARAAELVPGGLLLLQCFGAGEVWHNCDRITDALNDALLAAVAAGRIGRAGYETYYSPFYYRTVDEMISLVATPEAPLGSLFRLDRAETFDVSVPFVEEFRRTADVAKFASAYVNFFRAFTEPQLRMAFVDRPNVDQTIDEIFAHIERLICDDPERYELHYISVAALLTRRGGAMPEFG